MQLSLPIEPEIDGVIRSLGATGAFLSLLSVSADGLSPAALELVTRAACSPSDMTGLLADGSVAVLALDERGAAGLELRLLPRLRATLAAREAKVTLRVRSVHRRASDLSSAADLVQSLYNVLAFCLTLGQSASAHPIRRTILHPDLMAG